MYGKNFHFQDDLIAKAHRIGHREHIDTDGVFNSQIIRPRPYARTNLLAS